MVFSKSQTAPAAGNKQPLQGEEPDDHRDSRDRAATEATPKAAAAAAAMADKTAAASAAAVTATPADAAQPNSHELPTESSERPCSPRSKTVSVNAVSDNVAASGDSGSSPIAKFTTQTATGASKDTAGADGRNSGRNLQEVQAFLEERGLARWSQNIMKAAGAESMQDLRMMDSDDIEELIEAAGLPIIAAKKFRIAMVDITGNQSPLDRRRRARQSAVSVNSVESFLGPTLDPQCNARQPSSVNQEAPPADKQITLDPAAVSHRSAQLGVPPPLEQPEASMNPNLPSELSLPTAGGIAENSHGQGGHQCSSPHVVLPPASGGGGQGQAQTELQHALPETSLPSAKGATDNNRSQGDTEKIVDRIEWDYICVDPNGTRTDGGTCYKYGDIVRICERKIQGALQLLIADGSGWLLEKQNGRRVMSEVTYEEVPPHQEWLCTCPRLKNPVAILATPHCSLSTAAVSTGSPSLCAGDIVRVLRKSRMLVQMPKNKTKDQWGNFLLVAKPLSTGSSAGEIQGWVPELLAGDRLLLEYTFENEFGYPQPWGWLSVLGSTATAQLGTGLHLSVERKLEAGDLIEAFGKLIVGGLTFYRLSESAWTCANPKGGKPLIDIVRREPHWFIYVCCDKDGATVRQKPTRLNALNTGSKLRHRQRIRTSELVTFSDGDSFILSEIPRGWVPTTKKGSSVQKMKIIQSLENFPLPAPVRRLSLSQQQLQPGFAPMPMNGHPMAPSGPPVRPAGGTLLAPPMHGIPPRGGDQVGWAPSSGPSSMSSPTPPIPSGGDFGLGSTGGGCGPTTPGVMNNMLQIPPPAAGGHFGSSMGPEPSRDGRSFGPTTGPELSDFGLPPSSVDPRSSFVALPSGKFNGVTHPQSTGGDFGL